MAGPSDQCRPHQKVLRQVFPGSGPVVGRAETATNHEEDVACRD